MKILPAIKIGNYAVEASANHIGGAIVEVTVKCDGRSLTRKLSHQGEHNHTEEQFTKDIYYFAVLIATELAGKIRSAELAEKLTTN